jgi:putative two-component system response regulator
MFEPILMVIDDELGVRESLKMVFGNDFRMFEADAFDTALPKLLSERPHVVLLDVLLPRTDGIQALKRIKAIHPDCEVIMLTATNNRQIASAALDYGAFDVVGKPFDVIDLRAKVSRAMVKIFQSHREPVPQT